MCREFDSALTAREPLVQISESNKTHPILLMPHANSELTYVHFALERLSIVSNLHGYVNTVKDKTKGLSVSGMSLSLLLPWLAVRIRTLLAPVR